MMSYINTKEHLNFITNFVFHQCNNIFPDGNKFQNLKSSIEEVISDSTGFDKIKMWNENPNLDIMNSIQYPIFLYKLSRKLFLSGDVKGATKIFYLNKTLHGIDLFYEIELGNNFLLSHCIGSVFCKASYGNYSVFYHGILIGKNNNDRPSLSDGLVMFPGSQIIGKSDVGENVVVSANTTIIDTNIPDNVYVFPGKGKKPILKDLNEYYADRYFIRE